MPLIGLYYIIRQIRNVLDLTFSKNLSPLLKLRSCMKNTYAIESVYRSLIKNLIKVSKAHFI
jgi:hypothetical protein